MPSESRARMIELRLEELVLNRLIATGLSLHRLNTWWVGAPIGHHPHFARLGLESAA
ncbi:hypothetical protein [Streptomyces sp. NPDC054794]